MNIQTCIFEHQVVAAVKTGHWTDELRGHANACSLCSDTIVITSALRQVGQKTSGEVRTVAYYFPWFRAQCVRKQRRLSKLDRYMLLGLLGIALLSVVGTVLWKWQVEHVWIMNNSSEPASYFPIYIAAGFIGLIWFLTEEVLHEG